MNPGKASRSYCRVVRAGCNHIIIEWIPFDVCHRPSVAADLRCIAWHTTSLQKWTPFHITSLIMLIHSLPICGIPDLCDSPSLCYLSAYETDTLLADYLTQNMISSLFTFHMFDIKATRKRHLQGMKCSWQLWRHVEMHVGKIIFTGK